MKEYFALIFTGGKSLIIGMMITLRELFRPDRKSTRLNSSHYS